MSAVPERPAGWWTRFKAWLVGWVARLLLRTVRLRVIGRELLDRARGPGRPVLYAFWHGRQLGLFKANPEPRLTVMTSLSKDGEMHTRICRRLGLQVVRGSSSRGGLAGLLALGRALREGSALGLAVDGPRGPAFQAKPGILALARQSGSAVVPITIGYRHAWIFSGAWDRFLLPRPFTRAVVAFGQALQVEQGARQADLEALAGTLTSRLQALTAQVDDEAGRR
jgi:hypothetical protein